MATKNQILTLPPHPYKAERQDKVSCRLDPFEKISVLLNQFPAQAFHPHQRETEEGDSQAAIGNRRNRI